MIGLWVQRHGVEDGGHWHKVGDRVHLAETNEKALEVLKDGYDNAFSYTPKEFDHSVPVQPLPPAPPEGAKREFTRGLRIRFRDDYVQGRGIKAEPGDAFYVPCFRGADGTLPCGYWDNCPGRHLFIVCPDGRWWNVDGRANNCAKPDDRNHRCWTTHGDPSTGDFYVDNQGNCGAGGGSIDTGTYHGHVRAGAIFDP